MIFFSQPHTGAALVINRWGNQSAIAFHAGAFESDALAPSWLNLEIKAFLQAWQRRHCWQCRMFTARNWEIGSKFSNEQDCYRSAMVSHPPLKLAGKLSVSATFFYKQIERTRPRFDLFPKENSKVAKLEYLNKQTTAYKNMCHDIRMKAVPLSKGSTNTSANNTTFSHRTVIWLFARPSTPCPTA